MSFAELKAAVAQWLCSAGVEEESGPASPRKRALSDSGGGGGSPISKKRFHAEVKSFFLSGQEGSATAEEAAKGKLRAGGAAAAFDDAAKEAQQRVRNDMSDMFSSSLELWHFLGRDEKTWDIPGQLGLHMRVTSDPAVALGKLDAAVEYFRDIARVQQIIGAVNVAFGMNPQGTSTSDPRFTALMTLVQHLGACSLFHTPAQRFEVKHKLCFIFEQACTAQFGDLLTVITKSAVMMLTADPQLSQQLYTLACLGGFFFLGGPRVPHLRPLHKFYPMKEFCKMKATRTVGELAEVCIQGIVNALYDNTRYPRGVKGLYVLPGLLLLGVILERSPQIPAVIAKVRLALYPIPNAFTVCTYILILRMPSFVGFRRYPRQPRPRRCDATHGDQGHL